MMSMFGSGDSRESMRNRLSDAAGPIAGFVISH
jgi:hypothetical protein